MTIKTQLRGNCQHCGRYHAVVRGCMSKHGYEVDGYFKGVCQGERSKPLQQDRSVADAIVRAVIADAIAKELRAAQLESGEAKLGMVENPNAIRRPNTAIEMVEWSSLPKWDQDDVLKSVVWKIRHHASAARWFASNLEQLADKVHGQPLDVVMVQAGPAPILIGEKRIAFNGVVTAYRIDRNRVYWTNERGSRGWTGSTAWRKLEGVE